MGGRGGGQGNGGWTGGLSEREEGRKRIYPCHVHIYLAHLHTAAAVLLGLHGKRQLLCTHGTDYKLTSFLPLAIYALLPPSCYLRLVFFSQKQTECPSLPACSFFLFSKNIIFSRFISCGTECMHIMNLWTLLQMYESAVI